MGVKETPCHPQPPPAHTWTLMKGKRTQKSTQKPLFAPKTPHLHPKPPAGTRGGSGHGHRELLGLGVQEQCDKQTAELNVNLSFYLTNTII